MPLAIPKRCGFRGCPKTTRGRYCDEHLPLARQFYDRRRGTTKERGYDSDWERVAEQRRQLDCCLCHAASIANWSSRRRSWTTSSQSTSDLTGAWRSGTRRCSASTAIR